MESNDTFNQLLVPRPMPGTVRDDEGHVDIGSPRLSRTSGQRAPAWYGLALPLAHASRGAASGGVRVRP